MKYSELVKAAKNKFPLIKGIVGPIEEDVSESKADYVNLQTEATSFLRISPNVVLTLGAVDTTNGLFPAPNTAVNRCYSNKMLLTQGTVIELPTGYVAFFMQYDSNTFVPPATTWGNTFTVPVTNYYRLLIKNDSITDLTSYLTTLTSAIIITPSPFTLSDLANAKSKTRVLTVGKGTGFNYSEIQEAIDNAGDSITNPVTILVYPGKYKRFSMVGSSLYTGVAYTKGVRYLSLIGIGGRDNIVVQSDAGDYRLPAAEIFTNGTVSNMTFISTHDTPNTDIEDMTRKAYAVHHDFGACNTVYDNCRMVSNQAPGIGIGLYANASVKLKNCDVESYAPEYSTTNANNKTNFSLLANHGGLYCHSQNAADITGQKLILDSCRISSQNGDKGLYAQSLSTGTDMKLTSYNTMAISYKSGGAKVSLTNAGAPIVITPDSYGNNDASLNYVAG